LVNRVSCVNTHCLQSFCFTKISVARSQEARNISYFDGLQFMDAKDREQPLPPTAVVGFRSEAGVAKDRSLAANIDANRALISFKEMPITPVEANHDAVEVTRGEIGRLAVEQTTLINDFEVPTGFAEIVSDDFPILHGSTLLHAPRRRREVAENCGTVGLKNTQARP
jgi:hypothetical protein